MKYRQKRHLPYMTRSRKTRASIAIIHKIPARFITASKSLLRAPLAIALDCPDKLHLQIYPTGRMVVGGLRQHISQLIICDILLQLPCDSFQVLERNRPLSAALEQVECRLHFCLLVPICSFQDVVSMYPLFPRKNTHISSSARPPPESGPMRRIPRLQGPPSLLSLSSPLSRTRSPALYSFAQ